MTIFSIFNVYSLGIDGQRFMMADLSVQVSD